MKIISTTSILALLGLATPSLALDIGGGFSLTGNLQYEHLSSSSNSSSFALLNADLVYESASGFGGFIGVDGLSGEFGGEEALYGALTYSGDFGKIQIGAPRGALGDYTSTPTIATMDYLDLQFGLFMGSFLRLGALSSDEIPLGVRYDGSFGNLALGASFHKLEDGRFLNLAVNYRIGETLIKAGIEHVSTPGDSVQSYQLGAEHDFGQLTVGAMVGNSEYAGTSIRSLQAYGIYSVNDRLDLTAHVMDLSSAGPDGTLYGLSASYDLTDMVYVEAGYLTSRGSGIGTDDLASVSLGVNF